MHPADRIAGIVLYALLAIVFVALGSFLLAYTLGGGFDPIPKWTMPPVLPPAQEA